MTNEREDMTIGMLNFRCRLRNCSNKLLLLVYMMAVIILQGTELVTRFQAPTFHTDLEASGEWTKTTTPLYPGRLFHCGWYSNPNDLFPDYEYQEDIWDPMHVNSTENDILVIGMYGPCLGKRRFFAGGGPAQIHKLFNGQTLYINGVAYGHLSKDVIEREYQIGPYSPPSQYPRNSLLVYFFAVCLGMINAENDNRLWDSIFDPRERRINTGTYKGVAYFTSNCLRFRQRAALRISEVIPVYYGRGCTVQHDNQTIQLLADGGRNWLANHKFFRDFKYCLVMENNAKDGYVTEKILNAFLAGCLPIYYGTRDVFDIFNKDAFLFYDIQQPQATLNRIRYLEEHPSVYLEMVQSPILRNGSLTIEEYFSIYPNVGNGGLNKKIRQMMGLKPLTLQKGNVRSNT